MITHSEPLFETLGYKDLDGQMVPIIGIDNFVSKMGTDDQIIVVDFEVKSKLAAEDLVSWFEKGYDFVLDADVSPGEIAPNRFLVYVEMRRRYSAVSNIIKLVDDLSTLTEFTKPDEWAINLKDDKIEFSEELIKVHIPLSPKAYREIKDTDLNEMRVQAGIRPKKIYTDKKDNVMQVLLAQAGVL